jgi:hypothetical protein
VKKILYLIGTPFNSPGSMPIDDDTSLLKLYRIAYKNKLGLLFLESVAKQRPLQDVLQDELNKEREKKSTIQRTAQRSATILNYTKLRYAVIKSSYPFPAVPNDVDILILGPSYEYRKAVETMKKNQFVIVGGNEAPLEVCLHDNSRGKHFDDPSKDYASKDPFDVDIYKEVGASHIVYMDKKKLLDQVTQTMIDTTKVNVLTGPAEIALSIFHSIYPERIYTLLLHFHILYAIKGMSRADVSEFVRICRDHHMCKAVTLVLSLTERIQEMCFGKPPADLINLREAVGKRKQVLVRTLPYLYPMRTVLSSFIGKRNDMIFSLSVLRQLISMLNPRYARYIFLVYKDRKNRDTY